MKQATTWDLTTRTLVLMGFPAAAVLIVNALKRAGLIETTTLTQLIAPMGQLFALAMVVGLGLSTGLAHRRLLLIATVTLSAALAAMTGVEFILNFVFPYVDEATLAALLEGPLRLALLVTSLFFLGACGFATFAWWRSGVVAPLAGILFTLCAALIAFRFSLPDWVLPIGVGGIALFCLWCAATALRRPTAAAV